MVWQPYDIIITLVHKPWQPLYVMLGTQCFFQNFVREGKSGFVRGRGGHGGAFTIHDCQGGAPKGNPAGKKMDAHSVCVCVCVCVTVCV